MKRDYMRGASALAISLFAAGLAAPAFAQDSTVEEVVVTGSLIRGTPEDAALPVDVIGAEELAKQGNPSTVELIKALPASQGVLGDSNQFDSRAQGSEGIGSINLRGLGSTRTLVLFNGRRLAASGFTGAVDTNMIPASAVGRIEVLKDGAAVTYGSEAIAGVVNFITPTNFEGLQVSADHTFVDGSDGDTSAGAKWGWVGDNGNIFVSVNFIERSRLPVYERDWANRPFAENPAGGWTPGNNPGLFRPIVAGTNPVTGNPALGAYTLDSGCEGLDGLKIPTGTALGSLCYWRFANWDNLVEPETRFQLYAEANADLAENMRLHIEGMFSKTDVTMSTSPSYSFLNAITNTNSPYGLSPVNLASAFFVPKENPGLAAYALENPGQFPNGNLGIVLPTGGTYRPFSLGGNPLYRDSDEDGLGAGHGKRDYELARVSAELTGEFEGGIGYNVALTYTQSKTYGTQEDTVTELFQLALMGLGGPDCNPVTGTPGVGGCKWFYPMSNSVEMNTLTGRTNDDYNPLYANDDKELINWFYREVGRTYVNRLFVGEFTLNGELPISLPGGNIGWAAGAQYRLSNFNTDITDVWNLAVNPCIDTPVTGNTACTIRNGPLVFLGGFNEQDLESTAYAVFTEFALPVTDDINVSLAARYEDYGGSVGSTFDPKVSARWQINDIFALRGSYSTTFRAPPASNLSARGTSLQSFFSLFRPVDIIGSPDLKPETATTYSVGGIMRLGGLRATIDYWSFEFDNPIGTEPSGNMVSALFTAIRDPATGAQLVDANGNPRWVGCEDASYANLKARFDFSDGVCKTSSFSRLRTFIVNGAPIKTSGVDLLADYDLPWTPFEVETTIGTTITWVREYSVDDFTVEGVTVAPAFDGVGFLNYQTSIVPVPELKGQVYVEFNRGDHNLRLTGNYIDSYIDRRQAEGVTGREIESTFLVDAAYRANLPWETTLALRVANVFDTDPSFARLDLNYDPFTGNPLGRTYKISLSKKF